MLSMQDLALRAASAVARYDSQANVPAQAERFARFLESGRFVPYFENGVVIPCAPLQCSEPAGGRAAAFERGVWFPARLDGRSLVSAGGAQPHPALGIPLRAGEGCAVGFLNLPEHLSGDGRAIDYVRLRTSVYMAVLFLDNILDVADYPAPQAACITRETRKLALGAFGLADVLEAVGVAYGSPEGRAVAGKLFAFINSQARAASQQLAVRRGPFPLFRQWAGTGQKPVRNAVRTALAQTVQPALGAGRAPGCAPHPEAAASALDCLQMQAAVECQIDGVAPVPIPVGNRAELQRLCIQAFRLGCTMVCLPEREKEASACCENSQGAGRGPCPTRVARVLARRQVYRRRAALAARRAQAQAEQEQGWAVSDESALLREAEVRASSAESDVLQALDAAGGPPAARTAEPGGSTGYGPARKPDTSVVFGNWDQPPVFHSAGSRVGAAAQEDALRYCPRCGRPLLHSGDGPVCVFCGLLRPPAVR